MNDARQLLQYINSLKDFQIQEKATIYKHVGALVIDAILQQGISYDSTVKPRVIKFEADYPQADTTSEFIKTFNENELSDIIKFNNYAKINAIKDLSLLLQKEKIESVDQFVTWFQDKGNKQSLLNIKQVGQKTIDYLSILVGEEEVAVDRHLYNFLSDAGIQHGNEYLTAQKIIKECALLMEKSESVLDHSIWRYMSNKSKSRNTMKGKSLCL